MNTRILKFGLFGLMLTLSVGIKPAIAKDLPTLKSELPPVETSLPHHQLIRGTTFDAKGSEPMPFELTIAVHPTQETISVSTISDQFNWEMVSNFSYEMIAAKFTALSEAIINELGYTERVMTPTGSQHVHFQFFNEDGLIREKTVDYGPNTLDSFLIIPFLQHALTQIDTVINTQFVIHNQPMKNSIYTKHYTTTDLTEISPQYVLPPKLKALSKLNAPVSVFEMGLTGFKGMVWPHKYYYIYQNTPPFSYIGSWGGPGNKVLFHISPDKLPI